MRWRGRQGSSNVEDLRSSAVGGGRGVGTGLELLLMIAGRFGVKGVAVALLGVAVLWMSGLVDPARLLQGDGALTPSAPSQVSPEEQELRDFVAVVLAGTEQVWASEFARRGERYQEPKLVLYRGMVQTGGCGLGQSAMGPFYCPADGKVYIDLSFYDELAVAFNAPGDFAQAYVIAHEIGHHVQNLLGTSAGVAARRGSPDGGQMSVRLELQADFYAGVWAHHSRQYLERGDIEEAMRAANAIGDDAIQRKSRGRVIPHAFTHGTSQQRMRWFMKGYASGRIEDGDTFSMPYESL